MSVGCLCYEFVPGERNAGAWLRNCGCSGRKYRKRRGDSFNWFSSRWPSRLFRRAQRRLPRLCDQSWCCEGARAGAEAIFIAAKTCDVRRGKPLGVESLVQPTVLSSFCCIRCFVFRPAVLCVQPLALFRSSLATLLLESLRLLHLNGQCKRL